jgi:hypothetical protein
MENATTFAHTIESATLNAGALENKAETSNGKLYIEFTGPRGSEIDIDAFPGKQGRPPFVVLSISEWQP